ncbi:MAG: IMS domain-containing protein [Cyanobacteria bacterium J06621_8]
MRIPLDYYRILSVPIKATAEQLNQAYGDRLLQQPRREYSAAAIDARQELIKYSYQVLSDSEQRATYDAQFLLNMQPVAATAQVEPSDTNHAEEPGASHPEITLPVANPAIANPTIEIPSGQLLGALLILHELGEYEAVLELGLEHLNALESSSEQLTLDTFQSDLMLTLALAYLELGREQWHRQEYEQAARSGKRGIDLLKQNSLFPRLQSELEGDLYRLRPYRILELISRNPPQSDPRKQGFKLLRSMLLQRRGIEGRGEDRSGLNFDQFLCFIQQLRTHLSSAEQQQLFDDERQRDSAIANYLAVYALLGRGFSLKQPELILRAQRKLDYLGAQQDVSWEQSIAALLLGHTEKAMERLSQTPDQNRLIQLQQYAPDSSDLLPGLCYYGEKWLQQDVMAQFRDLSGVKLTFKEYFADWQVQSFLEELAPPLPTKTKQINHKSFSSSTQVRSAKSRGLMSLWRSLFTTEKSEAVPSSKTTSPPRELVGATETSNNGAISQATFEGSQPLFSNISSSSAPPRQNQSRQGTKPQQLKVPTLPLKPHRDSRAVPTAVMAKAQGQARRPKAPRRKKLSAATLWQGRLFLLSLIFGVGALSFVLTKQLLAPRQKIAAQSQLAIAIGQPAVEIPTPKSAVAPKPQITFAEQSQQIVQTWLKSKSAAFGKKYQIQQLEQILAEPLLTVWRERAIAYRQANLYREYQHQVTLRSVKVNSQDKNRATVEAEVKEVAQHYESGKLVPAQSYDDNLLVRYQLIRKGEKWLINQAEVLKNL